MKWEIGVVVLIIAGALYYFWSESHFAEKGSTRETGVKTEIRVSEPPPPQKEIPAGTIMEDGTI